MAQIADVLHISAVLAAVHQELTGLIRCMPSSYRTPYVVLNSAERIVEVLEEAERRWVRSREEEAMADTRSVREVERQSVRGWLTRLSDAADDAAALVQDSLISTTTLPMARMVPSLLDSITVSIINRWEEIAGRLHELAEQYQSFGYATTGGLPLASCSGEICVGEESRSIEDDVHLVLVGRDDDSHRIIQIITQAEEGIIVPIFGLAGVGKTALARLVYHETRLQNYAKAWVDLSSLSRSWHPREAAAAILSKVLVSGAESYLQDLDDMDDYMISNRILELLPGGGCGGSNKKLLLVLDDLWVNKASELENLLCVGKGLVVIVTTPTRTFADEITSSYHQNDITPYELHPLSDDICWAIIKRASGFQARPEVGNIQEEQEAVAEGVGREIAAKCGGLPSAAQAFGRRLRSMNPRQWPALRDSWADAITTGVGGVLSNLRRVYHRLPFKARIAFALCAFVFPKGKGRGMLKRDLLNESDAFVNYSKLSNGFPRSDITTLLDISFLLRQKSVSTNVEEDKGEALFLTMNDLVHDLATYCLGDRLLIVDGMNVNNSTSSSSSRSCYALIRNLDATPLHLSSILPGGIRALRFEDCSKTELSDGAFLSAPKHLVFLDLSGCSLRILPSSIGQLKLLRYLNAPRIQDQVLPLSITGLHQLRYLRLAWSCQLSHLPDAFGMLTSLEHLDLSGCSGLRLLPESFGSLNNLRYLDLSCCSRLQQVLSKPNKSQFRDLEHLDLSGCSGLKTLLPMSMFLKHLDLSGCSCVGGIAEFLRVMPFLRYLNLSHRCSYSVEDCFHLKGLDVVLPNLMQLGYLGLSTCLDPLFYALSLEESRRYGDCITQLSCLRHLDLSHNKFLVHLPESIGNLIQLRTLDLSGCSTLQSLPESVGNLCDLRTLNISGCPEVHQMPDNTRRQLAKLPFLQGHELLPSFTPGQAGTSHEEQS